MIASDSQGFDAPPVCSGLDSCACEGCDSGAEMKSWRFRDAIGGDHIVIATNRGDAVYRIEWDADGARFIRESGPVVHRDDFSGLGMETIAVADGHLRCAPGYRRAA